jgi:hypothetical protein
MENLKLIKFEGGKIKGLPLFFSKKENEFLKGYFPHSA